ncbi:MAG: hypothetical protein SNJ35_08340 [Rikenellaceae bacterium]
MNRDHTIDLLQKCFDELAIFPYLTTTPDKVNLLQTILNILVSYPRPSKEGDDTEAHPSTVGAYLLVCNARNTIKLSLLGFYAYTQSAHLASKYFERAYSMLIDQANKITASTLLLITYTDDNGAEYSDTLAVEELSITPEWLERIRSVTVQSATPQRYKGKKAVELLQSLNVVTK